MARKSGLQQVNSKCAASLQEVINNGPFWVDGNSVNGLNQAAALPIGVSMVGRRDYRFDLKDVKFVAQEITVRGYTGLEPGNPGNIRHCRCLSLCL